MQPGEKKSTIVIPEALWRRVKIRAMDERTDFRRLVIKALERYLKTTKPKGEVRGHG